MHRSRVWVAVLLVAVLLGGPLLAATQSAPAPVADRSPAAPVLGAIAAVTGIAISPLLGTAAYGAYHYFRTPEAERERLPWFAQIMFWTPALLLVAAVAAKDVLGATLPPGWKKPLDVLETVENKVSALVAAGAVIPLTMMALSQNLADGEPSAAFGAAWSGSLATIGAIDGAALLSALTVPLGLLIFGLVWMASHTINVLILLSPWGVIDAALKAARLGVLSLLTLAATMNPWWGAAGSLVVIVIAWFIAGWAFRLTVFGTVFSWDFFTVRKRREKVKPEGNAVFAAGKLEGVPPRTLGRLRRDPAGQLQFSFRPWLVMPRREVPVAVPPRDLVVGRGLFYSMIETEEGGLALLPPRYHTHEEELVALYGFGGVREAGLRRAWSWIQETLGFGPPVTLSSTP